MSSLWRLDGKGINKLEVKFRIFKDKSEPTVEGHPTPASGVTLKNSIINSAFFHIYFTA